MLTITALYCMQVYIYFGTALFMLDLLNHELNYEGDGATEGPVSQAIDNLISELPVYLNNDEIMHNLPAQNLLDMFSIDSDETEGVDDNDFPIDSLAFKTLINCGNSSILYFRINLPNFVIRSVSSLDNNGSFTGAVPFILLNLKMLKGFPFLPIPLLMEGLWYIMKKILK